MDLEVFHSVSPLACSCPPSVTVLVLSPSTGSQHSKQLPVRQTRHGRIPTPPSGPLSNVSPHVTSPPWVQQSSCLGHPVVTMQSLGENSIDRHLGRMSTHPQATPRHRPPACLPVDSLWPDESVRGIWLPQRGPVRRWQRLAKVQGRGSDAYLPQEQEYQCIC